VKFTVIKLTNTGKTKRNLSVTLYYDWCFGCLESNNDMHVVPRRIRTAGLCFARNPYNTEFPGYTVFYERHGGKERFTEN